MRTRAYRPEAPWLPGRPIPVIGRRGTLGRSYRFHASSVRRRARQIQDAFYLFRQGGGIPELHDEINEAVVAVPFGRQAGLAASINRTLNTLRQDMHAKVPQAVSIAHNEAIAATRAAMQAQAQAGNVVAR